MNSYKLTFHGRRLGAIGITYRIEVYVQAHNPREAWEHLPTLGYERCIPNDMRFVETCVELPKLSIEVDHGS